MTRMLEKTMKSHIGKFHETATTTQKCKQIIKWSETHTELLGLWTLLCRLELNNSNTIIELQCPHCVSEYSGKVIHIVIMTKILQKSTKTHIGKGHEDTSNHLIVHIPIFQLSIIDPAPLPPLSLNFNFQLPQLWAPLKECSG